MSSPYSTRWDRDCNTNPLSLGTAEAILCANRVMLDDIKTDIRGVIDRRVKIIGEVIVGEGSFIRDGSILSGPAIIGKNCIIDNSIIGGYTSIGDNCTITGARIETSIIIGDTTIDLTLTTRHNGKRIANSLIGRHTKIRSGGLTAYTLTLRENSEVAL